MNPTVVVCIRLLWPASLLLALPVAADDRPRYLDPALPVEARIDDLLPRLTLEEKIGLVHGDSKFSTAGVPRLEIPKLRMSDGPHGVREEIEPDSWRPVGRTDDYCTYLPVAIGLAATWNPALARTYGEVIADEARQRGKNVMLGPGVNIQRTPLGGRNFEYLSEDPWLASRLAVAYIRGVQAGDVVSCVKHFALNNQEVQRGSIDVDVDERTLREIYLPAFEAAVREAGALAVMGAYNKFRGRYCCQNDTLLNQVLKREWGFPGLVMSDWSGTHDTREAVLGGLDLEMGTRGAYEDYFLARPFREGLQRGDYPVAVLDDKVRRNLRVLLATQALGGRKPGSINTKAHQAVARQVADESFVLLKNSGRILPLDLGGGRTIAVIGDNAVRLHAHGGQSSELKAFYEVTPLEGIVRRVGTAANVTFSAGFKAARQHRIEDYEESGVARQLETDPAVPAAGTLLERAVLAAQQADLAIVVAGLNHERFFDTEGSDRRDLALPYAQDELIQRVAAANPRTIVVLYAGSPVAMDAWLEKVPAVVQAWYPGMEGGNALAGVLFGDVNPSGKLPVTFPHRLADSPAHHGGAARTYPGEKGVVHYDEGLLVGYRWFDARQIEPLFPFGFGLSYTTFGYSHLRLTSNGAADGAPPTVECEIANTGDRAGAEVVQVYVEPRKPTVPRPPRELKGFAKIALKPGETRTVSIPLGPRAFAFYSTEQRAWIAEAGTYTVVVGGSSRDLRLRADFTIAETRRVD